MTTEQKSSRAASEKKLDELQTLIQKWAQENDVSCLVAVVRHKIEVGGKETFGFGMVSAGETIWEDALMAWGYGVANERRRYLLDEYKVLGIK